MPRNVLLRAVLPRLPKPRQTQSRYTSSSNILCARYPKSSVPAPRRPLPKLSKSIDPSLPQDTSSSSPLRRPLTKEEREDQRWYFFYLLSGTVFFGVLSFYGFSYYKLVSTVPIPSQEEIDSLDLESVWKKDEGTQAAEVRAQNYDEEINSTEWLAGLYKIRQKMINQASGDVLESAVGTGRNGDWYAKAVADRIPVASKDSTAKKEIPNAMKPKILKSVTMVDVSEGMIAVARDKWEKILRRPDFINGGGIPTRFVVADLAAEDFSNVEKIFKRSTETDGDVEQKTWPTKFDTVIQTNGLCSTKHPEVLLRNLAKLVKPDGKILLLEHGRSYYDMINNVLDRTAVDHAKKHGCLWNRDIEGLVKDSGLKIESMKRTSFGTHYYMVLRPSGQRDQLV